MLYYPNLSLSEQYSLPQRIAQVVLCHPDIYDLARYLKVPEKNIEACISRDKNAQKILTYFDGIVNLKPDFAKTLIAQSEFVNDCLKVED